MPCAATKARGRRGGRVTPAPAGSLDALAGPLGQGPSGRRRRSPARRQQCSAPRALSLLPPLLAVPARPPARGARRGEAPLPNRLEERLGVSCPGGEGKGPGLPSGPIWYRVTGISRHQHPHTRAHTPPPSPPPTRQSANVGARGGHARTVHLAP
eukprot:364344-Chlamydomonas_euryale.AAC.11